MKNLCVIFGGASSEHDISIITAMQLKKNYTKKSLEMIYLGLDNKFYLATNVENLQDFSNKNNIKLKEVFIFNGAVYAKGVFMKKCFDIECVINCCHGGAGENGDLAGFLALNKINFTSSNSLSAHITMDKNLTKVVLRDVVPTVKGELLTKDNFESRKNVIEKEFSNELIVKPNSMGSSIGVKACSKTDYMDQVMAIFEMGDNALVEDRIVDIVEYNQACFKDGEEFVLSEIESPKTKSEFLSFDDKFRGEQKAKGSDREIPANITGELKEKICVFTKEIYSTLNLNGVVRIDYIFDRKKKRLYFNEVNTVPGSMAFYLYEPVGVDYITLIDKIVENATKPTFQTYFDTEILKCKKL